MEKYDVVIIGAGVGGLTCGCYLAKAGLKVLIVEQHNKPGGYCTSFERQGFKFDVGVHYLGCFKNKFLGVVLNELDLNNLLQLNRFDPTDKIILPDRFVYIRTNPFDTIHEFKKKFPNEKLNIESFFKFIMQKDLFGIYKKCLKKSFKDVLDAYFIDYKIKAALEVLLSNIGLSAEKFCAFSAIILYRDYILDGGYYPNNSMQDFPDSLTNRFIESSGELRLKTKVTKIILNNNKAIGIMLQNKKIIKARFVVSNCDATQTFKDLCGNYNGREKYRYESLIVSPSLFAVYIGLREKLNESREACNIWNFDTYEVGKCLTNLKQSILKEDLPFLMISFPSLHSLGVNNANNTLQCFILAPFESKEFWEKNRDRLTNKILKKVSKLFPDFQEKIVIKLSATPLTFYRYTLNKYGAAFGWASLINQVNPSVFPQKTSIEGLFLAGHWCTIGSGQGGVPKSVFSGRKAASLILQECNKKWEYSSYLF